MRHPTTDAQYEFGAIVGAKLALTRKHIGATQTQLAEVLGLQRASIGNIEQGIQGLTAYNLWRLAEYLGVSVEELLPGTPLAEATSELATVKLRQATRLETLLNKARRLRGHLDEIIMEIERSGDDT